MIQQSTQQNNLNNRQSNLKINEQNNQTSNQMFAKGSQVYGQTPGGMSEIRNIQNNRTPQGFDQEYYSSNQQYQYQQSQQGLYSQWDDTKNNQFIQQTPNAQINNQYNNQKQKNDRIQQDYNQDRFQQQQLNLTQSHNIYKDYPPENNQTQFYKQSNYQQNPSQQMGYNIYTPNPETQKKNESQIRQSNQQILQQQENSGQNGSQYRYETPIRNQTPIQEQLRFSQNKQDSNDPNLEDLQVSNIPVSLPVKIQGSIINLDSKISQSNLNNKDMTFQINNSSRNYQLPDNQRQSHSFNTSNYPLINPTESQREQSSGYFYKQQSQQKQMNNQQAFNPDEDVKQNLNQYDFDDDTNMNNSNNPLNNIVPQTINYHPSKIKTKSGNFNYKNQQKPDASYEHKDEAILCLDETEQLQDENSNNLIVSSYQRDSNKCKLYSQYNDFSNNNQQRDADYYRSDNGRKESLFKYDPSMFQSITGYFYPSVGTQQAIAASFNKDEALLSLNKFYQNQPQKLQMFQSLIQKYLVEQERVFIQRINREISGLQSAENLGDFFIHKYKNNLQKRVAGCSRAQIFPVYIGVRGDGNCFYRALIVNYLVILLSKYDTLDQFEQLIIDIYNNKHPLIDLEYQGQTRSDRDNVKIILMQQFLLLLIERMQATTKEEISLFLMKMFDSISSDHDFDYSLVALCRSMILYALEKYGTHQVYQEYLIQEDIEQTRIKLCTYKEDAEYHAISLSTEIFRHPIQIIQLQKDKFGNFEFNEKVIYQPNVNQPAQGNIYILLNDGHYDLVFDRETCLDYFPSLSLFNNHQQYHDDLELLIKQPGIQQNLRQYYIQLMAEYEKFLKDQSNQAVKVRESYINLQTLYQTKIGRISSVSSILNHQENQENLVSKVNNNQQQNHLVLFDSIISQSQSQLKGQNTSQLLQSDGKKIDNMGSSNEKLFSQRDGDTFNQNLFVKRQTQQNETQLYQEDHKELKLKSNTQDTQTDTPNMQSQMHMKSTDDSSNYTFQGEGINFKSNFYNLHSDKLQKQQNFSLTPNPPSIISDGSKKEPKIQKQQQNNDVFLPCDHAGYNDVVIKSITCCKVNYEICYPCFKTRQIIKCQFCNKELLSNSRIAQTSKNKLIYCKKCEQKTDLVILFNKIYCKACVSDQK
ncbi:peptidase C65 otubain protein (macronuclear) [Tetrahymena thermophila SB210]|uniref:ubiquitinyl hydrolase 1 n=1 Tax=Tetrahymena thermophila (strain SB210) TaxID=312017 RepID=I7M7E6_TETTS|nr:peptidase C65 otubain protein [Tetrahymena thermophila SB210]EAR92860.2 peptidase C65 otubain protein [Tetrahymena thermophila SB210]|eukprot:XP_001013105.2 peptidase C65 otubain protein [Tetrahymena thermophila SB210]